PVTAQRAADRVETVDWSEPEPRWPESSPQPRRGPGPERSHYPRPIRRTDLPTAEQMSPDPVANYPNVNVGVIDIDVRVAGLPEPAETTLGQDLDEDGLADLHEDDTAGLDENRAADLAGELAEQHSRWSELLAGGAIVLQSILAVVFGAGLFVAFDQLWHWNNIVALVLTVLVTLSLVAAVQAVRKTVDIGSTLIAVAVGLLITLGPLALHAN
ncbi:MAG: hypothetical protein ACRDU4_14895, partial [Mycobacterium sp.]